ncbi:MAG TPA: BON domain-containing protein [Burkholderiales bacterium]|jgi:hyperosmotically inducible protein|nr:BON domain-containing protein [Burkholderiales bacterium]
MPHKPIVSAWVLGAMLLLALGAAATARAQEKAATFNDALITERVTSAIQKDRTLGKMDISIETRDGVVHLRGFVDSMTQVERAGALARKIEGVTAVRNTIRVTNRPSRARAGGRTPA